MLIWQTCEHQHGIRSHAGGSKLKHQLGVSRLTQGHMQHTVSSPSPPSLPRARKMPKVKEDVLISFG